MSIKQDTRKAHKTQLGNFFEEKRDTTTKTAGCARLRFADAAQLEKLM